MKVIKLAHLDKIFKIKSVTGANAAEASSDPEPVQEPEPQASENVDLSPNDETQTQTNETLNQKIIKLKKQILASKEMMMTETK